jgi:hypothetical protein
MHNEYFTVQPETYKFDMRLNYLIRLKLEFRVDIYVIVLMFGRKDGAFHSCLKTLQLLKGARLSEIVKHEFG